MIIKTQRFNFGPKATISYLWVLGDSADVTAKLDPEDRFCMVLEDVDRHLEQFLGDMEAFARQKVQNNTAIPRGTYSVVLDFSPHFGRVLPHVLSVPGYTGVRIHPGNDDKDTDGCLLVGDKDHWQPDWVNNSRATFAKLLVLIDEALGKHERITLVIT